MWTHSDCHGLWVKFNVTVGELEDDNTVTDSQLTQATLAVATVLLYKSLAQLGAVCNARLQEFGAAVKVSGEGPEGGDVYVFSVREHKTGLLGTAKFMLSEEDWERLCQYTLLVRPAINPNNTLPYLFV